MSFGFPARFSESRVYNHLPPHQLAWVVKSAFDRLGWQYETLPNSSFLANTPINLMSWGERISIEILPNGSVAVESKCVYPLQCVDWGKNKKNVRAFFYQLEMMMVSELPG